MPFSYRPDPPKRRMSPLDSDQKADRAAWQEHNERSADPRIANLSTDPELYAHVFQTQLGAQSYDGFNINRYTNEKAAYPPENLLYQGPNPPFEEEQSQTSPLDHQPQHLQAQSQNQSQVQQQSRFQEVQQPQQVPTSANAHEVDMPDAPELSPHVAFTPPGYFFKPDQQPGLYKPTLKQHMKHYELGSKDKIPEQFVDDTSDYIENLSTPIRDTGNAFAGRTPARQRRGRSSPNKSYAGVSKRQPNLIPELSPAQKALLKPVAKHLSSYEYRQLSPLTKSMQLSTLAKSTTRPLRSLTPPARRAQSLALAARAQSCIPELHMTEEEKREEQIRMRKLPKDMAAERAKGHFKPLFDRSLPLTGVPPAQQLDSYSQQQLDSQQHHPLPTYGAFGNKHQVPATQQRVTDQQHAPPPVQNVSSSLKRASPSPEHTALPQLQQSPPRQIINPVNRLPRPTATQLYPNLSADPQVRHPETAPAPEENSVRRISIKMVWTLADCVAGFFAGLYNRFLGIPTEQTEIMAVATDMSDTKRRAVCRAVSPEEDTNTVSPKSGVVGAIPGQFFSESDKGTHTPQTDNITALPAQMPETSVSSKKAEIPQAGEIDPRSGQVPKATTSTQKADVPQTMAAEQKMPQGNITPPESRPASKQEAEPTKEPHRTEMPTISLEERLKHIERRLKGEHVPMTDSYPALKAGYGNSKYLPPPDPSAIPLPVEVTRPNLANLRKDRRQKNKDADLHVGNLILKAKQVAAESPQERTLRLSIRSNKERVAEEESARKRQEEARVAAEKAKLESKEDEDKVRQKVENEAEERRQKVEKEVRDRRQKEAEERRQKEQKENQEAIQERIQQAVRDKLIRSLEPKWVERVATAMNSRNGSQVLATSAEGVEITRYSLGKILPQKDAFGHYVEKQMGAANAQTSLNGIPGWLDDEAVNAFFASIVASKLEQTGYVKGPNNVPSFVAYNTGWHKTYKEKGVQALKNWSRRKGIQAEKLLRCERIFFPINTGAHWVLLIISPQDRKIEFLDSAGGKKAPYFDTARKWLKMELGDNYHADEWCEADSVSTKQLNFDDCGVFACMNALASAKGKEYTEVPGTRGMEDARRMIVAVLLNGGFHGDWKL